MSTNYYFKIKNSDKIKNEVRELLKEKKLDFILGDKILNDEGWIFNDEIHIGKKSVGWRPLFEKTEYYSNVNELIKFYKQNKDKLIIIDEYLQELSLEELALLMFVKDGKPHECEGYFKTYFDDEGYQFATGEFE